MTAIALPASSRSRRRGLGRWSVEAIVLAACAAFMFLDVRTTPIVLWDESRIAVNALEMNLGGHLRLVTTFGFQPDLWNTKPPLLIWLMDLSMSAFGRSEAALRLPSAIAALGTLALAMSFTRRVTGSIWAGAAAAALLTLSISFFGEHGARTADYEPLLCFFTTGYLYVIFFSLHRRRPGVWRPLLIGALVCGAVMTKGVAGLLPGVGVPLYLLIVQRWRRPLQTLWYVLAGLAALVPPAAYLVLREHASPGYLHALMFNDVSGRFGVALDGHEGPPWFYLQALLIDGLFSAGLLAAAAPLALLSARRTARLGLIYGLCVAGGVTAVLSASATKLAHYAMTSLPFMAILAAIALHEAVKTLDRAQAAGRIRTLSPYLGRGLAGVLMAMVAGGALRARMTWLPAHNFYPQAMYGELFRSLGARGMNAPQVVEGGVVKPGVTADGVPKDYAPQFDFYRLLANSQGMRVTRIALAAVSSAPPGTLLATCDPTYAPRLLALGRDLAAVKGCVAVRR